MTCYYCGEEINEDGVTATELNEEGFTTTITLHIECKFRMMTGSIAHLERRCGCYVVGSQEDDPPGLTRREAAQAVFDYWVKHNFEQRGRLFRERLDSYVKTRRN